MQIRSENPEKDRKLYIIERPTRIRVVCISPWGKKKESRT